MFGVTMARPGDTLVAYEDNSFDVEYTERKEQNYAD